MLMNSLDPEVAEHPDNLVVYAGAGGAARSWDAFEAITCELGGLADDEALLVQSGKPVGVVADRELEPGASMGNNLGRVGLEPDRQASPGRIGLHRARHRVVLVVRHDVQVPGLDSTPDTGCVALPRSTPARRSPRRANSDGRQPHGCRQPRRAPR